MKVLQCISFLAVLALSQAASIKLQEPCDGTPCPAGCCPEYDWFCCADNMYCAATEADCPFVAAKKALIKMAAKKEPCDGTPCPAGCCPEYDWFCCADNMYCAATEADCPFVAAKRTLIKMAAAKKVVLKKEPCDGTPCPAGCCPEYDWFCCADNMYCAATEADCPFVAAKKALIKMAAKKEPCDGTPCPAGCCPEYDWFCCADNMYCAATEADCPFVNFQNKLRLMSKKF